MAVNLPPQYHDAEARYKKAQSPDDKLAALKEMWVNVLEMGCRPAMHDHANSFASVIVYLTPKHGS